jgi:hypothetical protein
MLTEAQFTALEYAASPAGGWPRAKANERSWVIRSYRALERRGLVEEIEADAKIVRDELRLHFVATPAGRRALEGE